MRHRATVDRVQVVLDLAKQENPCLYCIVLYWKPKKAIKKPLTSSCTLELGFST